MRRVDPQRPDFAECFGARLAMVRKRAEMGQDELGFRTSMHRTTISQIERGIRLPGLDSAVKIAAALETSLDELLAGIHWRSPEMQIGSFELPEPISEESSRPPSDQ